MQRTTKILIGIAAAAGIAAGAGGIAVAAGVTDSEEPITGPALDKASAAALDHTTICMNGLRGFC